MEGYFSFHRKYLDSPLWLSEKFTRGQAWIDLVGLANHKPAFIRVRGQRVDIERGQLAWSEISLAERWKWSRGKVRRFLKEIESEMEQKIIQQKDNLTTLITILNYDLYQNSDTAKKTTNGQQTVQQTDSKQYTDNNVNNVNNKYSENSDEFRLSNYLFNHIRKRNPSHRKPDLQKWAAHINYMIRLDLRPLEEIKKVIEWCQKDEFWQNNILSTQKLRVQYDQLILKMGNGVKQSFGTCPKCKAPNIDLMDNGLCLDCSRD